MPVPKGSTKARVPTALKIIKGSLNPSRENKAAPKIVAKVPDAPAHLDEEEREAWERFRRLLDPLRVCGEEDFAALESLVTTWVSAQRLRAQIRRDAKTGDKDLTYESMTQGGGTIQRPKAALTALNEVDRRLKDWLGRFGLTPADRGRVNQDKDGAGKKDPDSEFS